MISIDYYTGLFELSHDICQVSEGNTGQAITDELYEWLKENGMRIKFSGILISWNYKEQQNSFTPYTVPLEELQLGMFAQTSTSNCSLIFETEQEAVLFKLTWVHKE